MRFYRVILCFLFILISFHGLAAPVDSTSARHIAQDFFQQQIRHKGEDLNASAVIRANTNEAAYYIFNYNNSFVIISGSDATAPILAYSDQGAFNNATAPEAVKLILQQYAEQIGFAEEDAREYVGHSSETERVRLANSNRDIVVQPFIQSNWGQGEFYNDQCPEDAAAESGHAAAGCIAVAMAQVLRYWQYPINGFGVHSYTAGNYGTQYADFSNSCYYYNQMPGELTQHSSLREIEAVSSLIYHCGVGVEMNYGTNNSSAFPTGSAPSAVHALNNYFGYGHVHHINQSQLTDHVWKDTLKHQLDRGNPIILTGIGDNGWHTFICDGYDTEGLFHINWGWNGNYNGYYALNALTPDGHYYHNSVNAIIDLYPTPIPSINVSPCPISLTPHHNIDSLTIQGVLLNDSISITCPRPGLLSLDGNHWSNSCNIGSDGGEILVTYDTTQISNDADYTFDITFSSNNVMLKLVTARVFNIVDTIFATCSIGGSIEPSGMVILPRNSNQQFRFTNTDSTYVLSYLKIDEDSITEECHHYTFYLIQESHRIHAQYRLLAPHIQADTHSMDFWTRIEHTSDFQSLRVSRIDFTENIHASVNFPFELSIDGLQWQQECELTHNTNFLYLRFTANDSTNVQQYLYLSAPQRELYDSVALNGHISGYNIYLYNSIGGHTQPNGPTISVDFKDSVTIHFIADEGYEICKVYIDDIDNGRIDSVKFTHLTCDHSIFVQFLPSGVNIDQFGLQDKTVRFIPNPATDFITPIFKNNDEVGILSIHSISGMLIEKTTILNNVPINISHLSKGSYIFSIENEGSVRSTLIIKN